MLNMGMASGPSLADIAAVTERNNGYGDGFGFGGAWWVIIILFAMFGGWGGNWGGNGNRGCQDAYDTQAVVQRAADTGTIISKLDGINNGICSLGYDQLAQMNGISREIMQGNFGLQQAVNTNDVNNMRNTWQLSSQFSECCCENRQSLADLKYTMATESCATNNNIHQTGDAIIQNQNQGFQMLNQTIKDGFCDLEKREMQREIDALRARENYRDRELQLQSTASYIVDQVRPTPRPAWRVENPWASCNNAQGCGNCCGNNFAA